MHNYKPFLVGQYTEDFIDRLLALFLCFKKTEYERRLKNMLQNTRNVDEASRPSF